MSVKVAVRCRPFNGRELEMGTSLCIDMKNNTTVLLDVEDPKHNRDFTFDYSFWSHDGFEIDGSGLNVATGSKYADQQQVFNTVGKEILNNAWDGYHCCLFAYGQTGSGKSYSMVGYGANKGIVPIMCEEIFNRIQNNSDQSIAYEVQVSMLEIYNEKVQDLLIPTQKRPAGGLKVREHKVYGVYVEGLTKHAVESYIAIEKKMDEGNQHRTVAATLMNANSSRAHTIIQIEFKQVKTLDGKKTEKLSVINLVDLAGSEKVGKTGVTGDRLKEAGQINKSLSCLGLVISTLAEKSMGGKNSSKVVVPYRDSSLTRILQNALGGNSRTLMICAVSPALDNYDETLSTLRYADQAKKIKCNAVINESETDKMIRELRGENDKLKNLLMQFQKQISNGGTIDNKMLAQVSELQENLEANQYFMEENSKTFAQKLEEKQAEEPDNTQEQAKLEPHLMNLNEDPLLNGKLRYPLQNQITYIGRQKGQPTPDIILQGLGIQNNHASIENCDGDLFIAAASAESTEFIFVNGEKIQQRMKLSHCDRLILGTSTTFLVQIPKLNPNNELEVIEYTISQYYIQQLQQNQPQEIDWESAQKEFNEKSNQKRQKEQDLVEKEMNEDMDKKMKELELQKKVEKEEAEAEMRRQREEFERKYREMEEVMKTENDRQRMLLEKGEEEKLLLQQVSKLQVEKEQKALERERQKKLLEDEETMKKYRIKEKNFIENKLAKYLPKVLEVNLIAKELKRNVQLQAKLKYVYETDCHFFTEDKAQKGQIKIQVNNREEGQVYLWDLHKFSNRYYIIKELLDKYFETTQIPVQSKQEDPFWDPPEARLIGQGFLRIQSLAYLMDNPSDLTLVGENGYQGSLSVNLLPTDDTGQRNLSDDIDDSLEPAVEDPVELLGKRFDFRIVILNAKLSETLCKDTFVEYVIQMNDKDKQSFRTQTLYGSNPNPQYQYDQIHTYYNLTDDLLNYLIQGTVPMIINYSKICFKVFGFEEQKQTKPQQQRLVPVEEKIMYQSQMKKDKQQQEIAQTSQQTVIQEQQALMDQFKLQQQQHEEQQKKEVEQKREQEKNNVVNNYNQQSQTQFNPININPVQLQKRPSQVDAQQRQGRTYRGDENVVTEQQQINKNIQDKQNRVTQPKSKSIEKVPQMANNQKKDGCGIKLNPLNNIAIM